VKRYAISAQARLDLREIWNHIAERDLDAADKVLSDIEAGIEKLAEFPNLGHPRKDVTDPRLRFWRVHSFLIAYVPDARPLSVSRVVHGHRDFRRLFPRRPES
jgi:plasmid stabilization system protein ParE